MGVGLNGQLCMCALVEVALDLFEALVLHTFCAA
jgi:hypothetical protein